MAGMGVGRIGAAASEDLMQRLGQDMFNPLTPYQSQASMPLPPALTASFAGESRFAITRAVCTAYVLPKRRSEDLEVGGFVALLHFGCN